MSIIVTEEDWINRLLRIVIITSQGHEIQNYTKNVSLSRYPVHTRKKSPHRLWFLPLTHPKIQPAINIQGLFKNKRRPSASPTCSTNSILGKIRCRWNMIMKNCSLKCTDLSKINDIFSIDQHDNLDTSWGNKYFFPIPNTKYKYKIFFPIPNTKT